MEIGELSGDAKYRSRSTAPAVLLVGILLVALGITYQAATTGAGRQSTIFDNVAFGVLIAVGGGVIGASLNTLIVRKFEWDVLSAVREVVANSLSATFLTEDRELSGYRKLWHNYHVTQVGEKFCWWYETCSFAQDSAVGSLTQDVVLCDSLGNRHGYLAEVGIRGNRLIRILTRKDSTECATIEVFPMPRGFHDRHAGIVVLETWDSTQIVSKAIMSEHPLVRGIPEGRVNDEHAETLDKAWRERFSRTVDIVLED